MIEVKMFSGYPSTISEQLNFLLNEGWKVLSLSTNITPENQSLHTTVFLQRETNN